MTAPTSGYKFGNKNQWRRWTWNRIVELLHVPQKHAVTLYLPGPDDFDREEALRRGFSPLNLIGVDRNARSVEEHRASGRLGIHGDFTALLRGWNESRPAHVVFGDFTSGLQHSYLTDIVGVMFWPHYLHAVWAFNFMRGRDPSSNWFRDNDAIKRMSGYLRLNVSDKHRGAQFYTFFLMRWGAAFRAHLNAMEWPSQQSYDEILTDGLLWQHAWLRPSFYSYRSTSGQIFDTCVFAANNVDKGVAMATMDTAAIDAFLRQERSKPAVAAMRRKASATLAIRSRKLG